MNVNEIMPLAVVERQFKTWIEVVFVKVLQRNFRSRRNQRRK